MISQKSSIVTAKEHLTFEERIKEVRIGACRLLMLPLDVENVVSWEGSFLSSPDFAAGEEMIQGLTIALLDKGTLEREKFEIAEILENKGAEIHFKQRGLRVGFTGQSLRNDFSEVFGVLAEQMLSPRLADEEYQKARMRLAASIQRKKEQTGMQAGLALRQLIYPASHPNYSFSPEHDLEKLGTIDVSDLRSYHTAHFGADDCIIAVVGDIDPDAVEQTVAQHLVSWNSRGVAPRFEPVAPGDNPRSVHVPMEDKFNLDVKLGHGIDILRQDTDFTPLYVGNYILGGNFSSRLMDIIRDEKGLTYGVYSSLSGVSRHYTGHWQIAITLSQDRLREGIEATRALVTDFVDRGVTENEVEEKKTTIAGTFKVQMGTTHGLAGMILRNLERGFDKRRLDTFPTEVASVTVDRVNEALRKYLHPKALHQASAGTLPA